MHALKSYLCTNYEEAWGYYQKYKDLILGIISDVDFPHNGVHDPHAGIEFAKNVKKEHSDIPILLLTNNINIESEAKTIGTSFVHKDSPLLINEMRQFMKHHFSFGEFIFRMPDGTEVGRANNLRELENQLKLVPSESIAYHGERNHFSNWLKARTEFWLAHQLRPRKISDYATFEDLRQDLIKQLHSYRNIGKEELSQIFKKILLIPTAVLQE